MVSQVPLAVGMPMRLTDTVDHQRQLFRGRRCRILGWAPHPREERLDVDGEWVLTKMHKSYTCTSRTRPGPFTQTWAKAFIP